MTMQKVDLGNAYRLIGHGPTVLVSTTDGHEPDASAVAWCTPASKAPPRFVLRIGEAHKTYENLMKNGCCVLNIPTADCLDVLMHCGRNSGHEPGKLERAGIEVVTSSLVEAPRLACCAAWIECNLIGNLELDGSNLVLVEAVCVECRSGVVGETGHMDVECFPTLHHLGGSLFSVPGVVREHK